MATTGLNSIFVWNGQVWNDQSEARFVPGNLCRRPNIVSFRKTTTVIIYLCGYIEIIIGSMMTYFNTRLRKIFFRFNNYEIIHFGRNCDCNNNHCLLFAGHYVNYECLSINICYLDINNDEYSSWFAKLNFQ